MQSTTTSPIANVKPCYVNLLQAWLKRNEHNIDFVAYINKQYTGLVLNHYQADDAAYNLLCMYHPDSVSESRLLQALTMNQNKHVVR